MADAKSEREIVLPIYFVADHSNSMTKVIDEVNEGLSKLLWTLRKEPMAAARIRFAIIGFADHPVSYLKPSDLRNVTSIPLLSAGGRTSYSEIFRYLKQTIAEDVTRLRAEDLMLTRPSVFFVTDGRPTDPDDDWRSGLAELKDENFPARPNILAFGVGPHAQPEVILEVATNDEFAMLSAKGADVGESFARLVESLTESVVGSGQALASGSTSLPVMKPQGFELAIDLLN